MGLFPCPRVASLGPTVHQACDRLASSFFDVSPLQSSFTIVPAPLLSEPSVLPGFRALLATSPVRVHASRGSRLVSVPSAGILSLSTVCSAHRLRGLFHPRAASRTPAPFRGFSPRAAGRLVADPCPPAVVADVLTWRHSLMATRRRLGFEALLRAGPRSPRRGYSPRRGPLPSSVSSPPGPPPLGSGLLPQTPPLVPFVSPVFACAMAEPPRLQRINPCGRAPLSPETPTCSSFVAYDPDSDENKGQRIDEIFKSSLRRVPCLLRAFL